AGEIRDRIPYRHTRRGELITATLFVYVDRNFAGAPGLARQIIANPSPLEKRSPMVQVLPSRWCRPAYAGVLPGPPREGAP
ncbi:MAG: hypothetical protein M3Q49_21525, partial [Actinomycetota bacterium]|nr:hypothetical protein [Actinomycetota bacterium]